MNRATTARAPTTPLIVHDPFMSVWSWSDTATDSWPAHWTGKQNQMSGLLHIDGHPWRFMGGPNRMAAEVPAMQQLGREITPLRTIYRFAAAGIELTLSFTSPLLPDDLELLGRPASYVDLAVRAIDGRQHQVCAYYDWSATWTVGDAETELSWGRHRAGPVEALFMGAAEQRPLKRSGDEVQVEWGYLFVSSQPGTPVVSAFGDDQILRETFARSGAIPARDDVRATRPLRMPAGSTNKVAAFAVEYASVGETSQTWSLVVAYDHVWALTYFDRRLRPYWSRNGQSAIGLVETAWGERDQVLERVAAFDAQLLADLERSGGEIYTRLGILAFRQCLGAHVLAEDFGGDLLHFSKEGSSNGSMGTVDLTYPGAPFFLHFNPTLLEAQMRPVLAYAKSGRWPFPYAPHDVGHYPWANGQNYGGGDRTEHDQMPVEESGNMLILAAALARRTGSTGLAENYWAELSSWADYLVASGLDPENQLCTDDFAGHMPHNANLAIKAILGIGAFGQLCRAVGKLDDAERYLAIARDWAVRWEALADDGHAYRLAFDQPGTWSQKYNLVWDRILGLDLFAPHVAEREGASYRKRLNAYGLPLDSRMAYTKLDWLVWSACLTGRQDDFDAMLAPLADWLNAAPQRVPLSDWFETDTGKQPNGHGFWARSVVGGIYIKLMIDSWSPRA